MVNPQIMARWLSRMGRGMTGRVRAFFSFFFTALNDASARAAHGAMVSTSAWPLLSSVMLTTSCDYNGELSAL